MVCRLDQHKICGAAGMRPPQPVLSWQGWQSCAGGTMTLFSLALHRSGGLLKNF